MANLRNYRIRLQHDKLWKPLTILNIPEAERAAEIDKLLKKHLRIDSEIFSFQCVLGKFTRDIQQQCEFWEISGMNYEILTPDDFNYDNLQYQ